MNPIRKIILVARDIVLNVFSREQVVLISEKAKWAIYEDCLNIQQYLEDDIKIRIAYTHIGLRNKIIHFAAPNTFLKEKGIVSVHKSNKVVLAWFHIVLGEDHRISLIPEINKHVDYLYSTCNSTIEELIKNGLTVKTVVIPVGVDTNMFHTVTEEEKKQLKRKLHIPENKIVIGSFQKDGNGWGEGDTPKLIKGPDIFCDVVERLSKKYPLHILLTGPSRGYVKNRLESAGIPYSHFMLSTADDVAQYYPALDFYLISSRAEGGPKALLESSASGTPVITTNVGMVPDIMEDGKDCYIAPIGDVDTLIAKSEKLLEDANNREYIWRNALETAKKYDIRNTVRQYYDKIYKNLLPK